MARCPFPLLGVIWKTLIQRIHPLNFGLDIQISSILMEGNVKWKQKKNIFISILITISSFLPSRGIDRINAIISAIPSVVLHVVSTYKEDVTYVYKNMEKMINLKMSQASDDQKHMLYVKLLQARQMFHRQQFWNKTENR